MNLVETLSDLVALPSVNPMGRDLRGPEFYEYRVTDYLEAFFKRLGVGYVRQTVEPLRDNIVARLDGDRSPLSGGSVLLLEAHQDTVPTDGMTIDPWSPRVSDGRLYGRGSCDIKGGMTAMLGAFERLARERPAGMPTIVIACTVNEEHGYTGATALCRLWSGEANAIIPRRPDGAVVAEPTNLNVVVAHKGAVRWRLKTHGRASHSSRPQLGDNAIYKMALVISSLRRYANEFAPNLPEHRLCGRVTLSVGTIAGGVSVNTVPDVCTIEIDRRLLPGETWESGYRQVIGYLADDPQIDFPIEHEPPYLCGSPLADTHNASLAEQLRAASALVRPASGVIGVPFGTDAAAISASGVPSVVFGPGSIDQAHTCDEWLPLDELELASDALYRFAREFKAPGSD